MKAWYPSLMQILELGENKAVVKSVYPVVLKMKRCLESYGFLTRDCSFPYSKVFAGEVNEFNQKRHEDDIVLHEELNNYKHLFSRRADYLVPSKLASSKKNPEIVLEFFSGDLKGTTLKFEKNLMYQIRMESTVGQVPAVKTQYSIGKDNISDYAFPFSNMKQLQCIVEFNSFWGWQVRDPTGHHEVSKTSVYLANKTQFENAYPSYMVQLFDGMVLAVGDYEFAVDIRNTDDVYPPKDLFSDDFERFYEETEDDVRKKMTGV